MCRWFIYFGKEILFEDILYKQNNSIIKQSYLHKYTPFLEESNKRDHEVNVDGYGIGWYINKILKPCYYTSIKTPWNDYNLHRLSKILSTKLIFAHIRAIKPFSQGIVHEFNCHPFNIDNFLFMHNGDLKNYNIYKKKIFNKIDDRIFQLIKGTTDSEYIFALILSFLKDKQINVNNVKLSIIETIKFINTITDTIFSFNIAITEGNFVIFTRYINNQNENPPSLYFKKNKDNIVISSEPIDFNEDNWTCIPKNTIGYYEKNVLKFEKI